MHLPIKYEEQYFNDSIKWMEDSDKENIEKETLEQQYSLVKKETNTSTVRMFSEMMLLI